jgi:hypothetical protein
MQKTEVLKCIQVKDPILTFVPLPIQNIEIRKRKQTTLDLNKKPTELLYRPNNKIVFFLAKF